MYGRYQPPKTNSPRQNGYIKALLLALLTVAAVAGVAWRVSDGHLAKASTPPITAPHQTAQSPPNMCGSNTLDQDIVVSISKRHLWACDQQKSQYDSAVVTGMENLAADLTPTGTYHIYDKLTDQTLKGCDSTGCWDDPVSYWMPWLSDQYGIYGFHDATWRSPSDFGNISPYSSNASHGCVELPLATAKWLYGWAQVGTTVTIET